MTTEIKKNKMNFDLLTSLYWEKNNIKKVYDIIDKDENADLTVTLMTNKLGNISMKVRDNKTDKQYVIGRLPEDIQAKVRRIRTATLHVAAMHLLPKTGDCEMSIKIGKSTELHASRQIALAL